MDQRRSEEVATSLTKWHLQDLRRNTRKHRRVTSSNGGGVRFSERLRNNIKDTKQNPPWPIFCGIFIIQFFIPGVLISHGVYLNHLLFQRKYSNPYIIVWPPTIFLFTWSITRPIFRHLGLIKQGSYSKILAACGTLILAIGLAASCVARNTEYRILTFGLIGGIGCSLVMTQSETQSTLHFRPSVGLCFSGVSQALGHFAAPLIMMALVTKYGSCGAPLVQAAVALHGLIGALFLRRKKIKTNKQKSSPPPGAPDNEEIVYSRVPTSPRPARNEALRSWKNPASDPLDNAEAGESMMDFDEFGEEDIYFDVTDDRLRNHMGVEILPQILEEDEEEEEDILLDFAQKRLSRIRVNRDSWLPMAPLEHYSSNQQDSTVEGDSPKPLLTPSSITGERTKTFSFERSTDCCSCADGLRALWGNMLHFFKSILKVGLVPTILINLAQKITQLGILAALPTVANQIVTYRRHEGAFSMAIVGFGWLCTMICTPCFLMPFARKQKGVTFSAFYLLSSVGFALLSDPRSHDRLTLGSVVVGMAHGALMNTTPSILYTLWGTASLKNSVQNAVDVLTAVLIIPLVALTNFCVDTADDFKNVFLCLSYLQIAMGAGALLWTIMRKICHKYESWEVQRQSFIS